MRACLRPLLVAGALILACESSSQPTPIPTPEPLPAAAPPARLVEPPGATEPSVEEADELPTAAGIHYLEIVTGGAEPNAELPMIVAIHGLGDDPRGFTGLFAGFDAPARIILPQALDPYETGYSWFPVRAASPDLEGLASGIERAEAALASAVAELTRTRPTRGKPILTGFSQGGMLTFALATAHPEQFSAAIALGGWLPPPLWPAAGRPPRSYPPIVALHGEADHAVRIGPTRECVDHLRSLGVDARLQVYPDVGHSIPAEMRAELLDLLERSISATSASPSAP